MEYIMDFFILGVIYFTFFFKGWRRKSKDKFLVFNLLYLYICFVLFVTLMPFRLPIPGIMGTNNLFLQTINCIPFHDLLQNRGNAFREIVLNVIMMMPFGFLLPLVKKRNVFSIAAWAFLFSLSIETMQLLYVWAGGHASRAFDVTDLITNTFGGIIGYGLYLAFGPISKKVLEQLKKS